MISANSTATSGDSDSARAVFVRWERWRIAYNLALSLVVVVLAFAGGGSDSDWRRFAWQCALGALVANVCYLAGPTTEAYLRWLGFRHRALARLLFACGLLLASGLAAITVTGSLIPF
jgi:hypothetical protein